MWYAFIPDEPNIQEMFTGFTDNPYLMKSYTDLMDGFKVNNLIPSDVTFDSMNECIEGLRNVRDYFVGDIRGSFNGRLLSLMDSPEIFAARNRLFSIHGKGINHDIVVVNDVIYENYGEIFFSQTEITKALHDVNRLCNNLSVKYMYQYLNDSSKDTQTLKALFARMYDIWKLANEAYVKHGVCGKLYPDSDNDTIVSGIFDEVCELRLYIASEVARFVWRTDGLNARYCGRGSFNPYE